MNTRQSFLSSMALCGALVAFDARVTQAQWNVALYDSTRSWVYSSFGLDPAFVGTLGLARTPSALGGVQLAAEAGWVVAKPDARDVRARLGARTTVVRLGALRLTGEVAVIGRGTSNSIYRALSFGAASNWTAGVYRPRWFAATEAGYDKSVATRITNTDWYRSYFYKEAKDAWYGTTGGTIHYGLAGGAVIGRAELTARMGFLSTEKRNELQPPVYASIGAGFRMD